MNISKKNLAPIEVKQEGFKNFNFSKDINSEKTLSPIEVTVIEIPISIKDFYVSKVSRLNDFKNYYLL